MNKPISICLTDDHKLVRTAIRAMLFTEPDLHIEAETENVDDLLKLLSDRSFDVIVLDILMPGKTGLEALLILGEKYPDQKVCMLTGESTEENIVKALELGAKGFVAKQSPKNELTEAIRTVSKGELYLGKSISKVIYGTYEKEKEINPKSALIQKIGLSEREVEVLKLLSDGLGFKEIGHQLFISARTVESHKNNILKKLHLKNTIELVKFAIKEGIISI